MKNRPIHIRAVLLRLEGTFIDQNQRVVNRLKTDIGCPSASTLIEFIQSLTRRPGRSRILSDLEALEKKLTADIKVAPAFAETIQYLRSKKIRLGIMSHFGIGLIRKVLNAVPSFDMSNIEVIFSRDEILRQKPEANLIRLASKNLKVAVANVLLISANDAEIMAAQSAGAITLRMATGDKPDPMVLPADFVVENTQEIKNIVRLGIPLPAGKLPNRLLRDFLNQFIFDDPTVLINPGVGEDIAAVDVESNEVLVLKSDPITFATDSIGQYAVLVNANDIATSGAIPRWFLTTLFFPNGTTASQIRFVFNELKSFCRRWGITLCGGHTEITDAVTRPIIAGMMAGTVSKQALIDKRNMAKGDRVFLTKGVAVEGTAIIAREFAQRLKKTGMAQKEIDRCRRFLDDISVIAEAKIAAATKGTSAMHDVTEGGLAAALEELSFAGNHKIKVFTDKIHVFPETKKICDLFNINPLGLIGSGSLLICCRSQNCDKLVEGIRAAGIEIVCIGEVMDGGQGIVALKGKKRVPWPTFEVDEITKLF
jgi:hydrogenase maturation factor/beta-phosphoglucomutase-like phosphatase (HAD superfamily)